MTEADRIRRREAAQVVKLTRQGVRDLGGVRPRRRQVVYVCPHVWERVVDWDAYPEPIAVDRCGFCQETRR